MLKQSISFIVVVALLSTFGCAVREDSPCGTMKVFTDPARELKSPGFWTSLHPFADEKILDAEEALRLNEHIRTKMKLTKDVSKIRKTVSGEKLAKTLKSSLDSLGSGARHLKTYGTADKDFLSDMGKNMRAGAIPETVKVKFALINSYADQRVLPTREMLPGNREDPDFDDLQNSSLDLGTPVAVLHESRDGKWLYTWGPSSDGWVEKEKVSFLDRGKLKTYVNSPGFVVVTGAKADIFLDPAMTVYHDYVRMGSRFPAKPGPGAVVEISIPDRKANSGDRISKAYISRESVSFGYLAYTPRNVIHQAFRLNNAPYSWGSANGEQDCSGFIQQVFASFGILLPRNSSAQAEIGTLLGKFGKQTEDREKLLVLSEKAAGGVTLVYMNGHIMLFLGMHEGKPYIIHDAWSYRSRGRFGDEQRVIGRVVVTGLDLGEGASRGSLLKRVLSIRSIVSDRND